MNDHWPMNDNFHARTPDLNISYLSQNLHWFHMEMPLKPMKTIPHLDITSSFEVWRLSYRVCYCSAWVAKRCAVLKVVSWPHCRPKSLAIEGQWTVITFCNGGQISHIQGFYSVSKVNVGEADTLVFTTTMTSYGGINWPKCYTKGFRSYSDSYVIELLWLWVTHNLYFSKQ